ncbi:halocyanin domain-containing protein [Halogeometricum borinquense]|uniref:Halocyanin domain-containing protein n=1 Tax=Halogeometricum borinquense TaxID=60847 RepID=A0A482TBZ8_9EURY|nr:halocyanin domain-containing protein [Halogeometricum borinquense]RYJ14252.1 halocyanin domain-containing protein [Halogeometricum borinquense]
MTTNRFSRRAVVRTAVGVGATAALGVGSSTVSAQSPTLSSWFSNTSNYDGVVDRTGQSEVTITVGASGNGGNFGFGPAAVRVDPGTTVVWKWNGKGSSHNVVAEDGSFKSEMVGTSGHTFSHTFEEAGVWKYACTPHKPMGMKGAVVVGDAAVGGESSATQSTAEKSGGEKPAALKSWFSNTSNYDGVVDRTGNDEVTVEVGAKGNGASFAFGPAAIRVDPGTTVVWEWNGRGGAHNVVAEDGSFKSEMVNKSGHSFSHAFEEAGTYKYACTPHKSMGMKGVVLVGDAGGGAGGSGGSSNSGAFGGVSDSALLFGGSLLGAFLSPIAVAVMLALGDDDRPPETDERTHGHPSD